MGRQDGAAVLHGAKLLGDTIMRLSCCSIKFKRFGPCSADSLAPGKHGTRCEPSKAPKGGPKKYRG